ncbi:MAG: BON domain-containing protein [Dehalococcoidia bacterium]|nr:BON domain-containing protein [Dehalococcoidia bacterium]
MTTQVKTDAMIKQDILAELKWDPAVSEADVGVEVDDGIVTLSGTVDRYARKRAAERAVLRVQGVRGLAENIEINVYSGGLGSDTEIATRVVDAIESDPSVPENRVNVRVENGRVTLTGSLDWQYQRARAEAVVRHLPGVTKIHNDITIRQPSISATEIRSGIEQAFARDARIDAGKVSIAVEGTHLTLSGTVRSWAEREAAETAAWRAKGVMSVTNSIKVNP